MASGRDMVEVICKNGEKIKIYNGSCKNFDKVKQWVEDFNNGLNVEDIITDDKYNIFLRQSDVKSATFIKAEMVSLW